MADRPISRRDLLRGRLGSLLRVESSPRSTVARSIGVPSSAPTPHGLQLAVIRPHVCLAHRWHRDTAASRSPAAEKASPCRGCLNACPTPDAIVRCPHGPSIDPERCTGCGECLAVCPAPVLAIALVARIASTSTATATSLRQSTREAPPAPP
ncbi:MAG: 4Fe-4S binding protein [Phycisphaerae bacterium]|nr:4Fe-4S binding protein [Phycisphaerae bacterium]